MTAQYNLGVMYKNGQGVKQDSAAAKWSRLSAEQGHVGAQYNLGLILESRKAATKADLAEAATWYRKAAEQGDADAQYNLSRMYNEGLGVKKDRSAAIHWLRKAAAQGDNDAKEALKSLGVAQ